jgi:hypothetical protein
MTTIPDAQVATPCKRGPNDLRWPYCIVGWGGCGCWSGGHLCEKLRGHSGPHKCGYCGRRRPLNKEYDDACT